MAWKVELTPEAEEDLVLILHHLATSRMEFGEDSFRAFSQAEKRAMAIRASADRIGIAPFRGVADDNLVQGLRHLTMDDAVYYFALIEDWETVVVAAIFYGGQDHQAHMLRRLLSG